MSARQLLVRYDVSEFASENAFFRDEAKGSCKMKSGRRSKSILTTLLFVALSAGLLFAQDQNAPVFDQDEAGAPPPPQANVPVQQGYPDQGQPGPGQQEVNPPGRVARVQYMSGDVSIQPGGVNDWIAASQNRPLTTSDRIWTDKNSRAELNVGDGFIRMNSETSLTLTNVSDQSVQLEMDQGTLSLSVRHLEPGEVYEVDTPNYAFTVMKSGVYRFDVYPSEDQSWVTVRSGYGVATGRGSSVRVNSGNQVRFTSGNSLQHTAEAAPARDGFDDWVQVRDKRLDDSVSARYVSPGVIGYQDLDQYGRWVPTPAYGNVWQPYVVAPGWAPYRFGHWVWIAPWGWTWVDDAPWGFAPFHYGRWVYFGGAWAWAPGPLGYWNPYYAPALVGWIGGPGFGVGFGFGGGFGVGINFGWFPLGWGEPFYPRYCGWGYGGWYRGGGYVTNAYIRNVNITNTHITNITNITNNYYSGNTTAAHYGFRTMPGAVTAAPASAMASGAAMNRAGIAVPRADLGKGTVLRGVSVNPTRQSVLGGRTPQTHGVPPSSAFSRSVVTANRTAATQPANLEAANQATLAHGNFNALNHGVTNGAGHPANAAANNRRGPSTSGTEARVDTTPTSQGGHYVPRPPSAGGVSPSGYHSGSTGTTNSQYGKTPGAGNSAYGRTNGNTANSAENRTPTASGNQRYGSTNSTVPRPTQPYEPGRQSTTPQHSGNQSHEAAPSHSGSSGSKESSHGDSSHGPGAALSVPHPPAGYSYHAAPTYSASAGYGASRPLSGYSRSTYGAGSSYNAGRSYGSTTPYFGNRSYPSSQASTNRSYGSSSSYSGRSYGSSPAYGRSYGSNPAYASRSYGSAPAYSGRSTGSYSAPRSSGGGSYRAPSGGSSRSSGGGGGGHHGR